MTPTVLEVAQYWLDIGVIPIPVKFRSKKPLVNWGYWVNHTPVQYHLQEWFGGESVNIGLICGGPFHLAVIDFDKIVDYYGWKKNNPDIAYTYSVRTSRGMHVYFQAEHKPQTVITDSILIKGDGGYVLAPPSVHPSGHPYRAINGNEILKIEDVFDLLPDVQTPTQTAPSTHPSGNGSMIGWIKDHISIVSIVGQYTEVKPTSPDLRWWICLCPFHDDHNPSFWLDNQLGLCNCFRPDCREHRAMDVINFYTRINGITNEQAITDLYDRLI